MAWATRAILYRDVGVTGDWRKPSSWMSHGSGRAWWEANSSAWHAALPLSGHIEIEDRALATKVVDLSAEQTVRDDGAAPRHQAQVGVRYPAHVPSRVLRVDPQLGRSVPLEREIGANGKPVPIPGQPAGERLQRFGQLIVVASTEHDDVGVGRSGRAPSVAEGEVATLVSMLHVDDLVTREQEDAPPSLLQELEVVEPVVNALQEDRRYAIARQPLLGKEDVALFRSQREKIIAIGGGGELGCEGGIIKGKENCAIGSTTTLGKRLATHWRYWLNSRRLTRDSVRLMNR